MIAPSPSAASLVSIRSALGRNGEFDLETEADHVVARRRRLIPSRGLFRLFFPHVAVRVGVDESSAPSVSVRPDAIAWVMAVVCAGGTLVELTTDRARYPVSYPPEFVYGLSGLYLLNLVVEWVRARNKAVAALASIRR